MKKLVLALVCLVRLLALGFVVASVTNAQAPYGYLATAAGIHGGGSAPSGVAGGPPNRIFNIQWIGVQAATTTW